MTHAWPVSSDRQAPQNEQVFVFGSLMDIDVLSVVLGDPRRSAIDSKSAWLAGYQRQSVEGEVFPLLVRHSDNPSSPTSEVEGRLLCGLTSHDLERLIFFEGPAYALADCHVDVWDSDRRRRTSARVFLATNLFSGSGRPWDFAHWCAQEKDLALLIAAETMDLYGTVACDDLGGQVWDGIKARAAARLLQQGGSLAQAAC